MSIRILSFRWASTAALTIILPLYARLMTTEKIGEAHILKITSRDPEPPNPAYIKVSGGIFLDMTIHDFDMACFLTDSDVEELYVNSACSLTRP